MVDADVRALVYHVSRKIKIVSGYNNDTYGFRVLVTNSSTSKGSVQFRGVQFVEGGQPDSDGAALQILNVMDNPVSTYI